MEKGNFIQNGVHLQNHEYATVKLLLEKVYNVELIPPIQIKGVRTPDLTVNGVVWEMKVPTGAGKHRFLSFHSKNPSTKPIRIDFVDGPI